MRSKFTVFAFVLMGILLILSYQNCAGHVDSSSSSLSSKRAGKSYTAFNPLNLDPSCISPSHTTMIRVDDPVPTPDTRSEGVSDEFSPYGDMLGYRSDADAGANVPIDLVIDDSIYSSDPTRPEVGDRYKELIEDAIAIWEDGIGKDIFNIIERPTTPTTGGSVSEDGYSTIYWNKTTNIGRMSNASGFACTQYTYTGKFVEGDIVINDFRDAGLSFPGISFFFDCFEDCAVPNSPVQQAYTRNLESFRAAGGTRYRAVHFVSVMAHELGHVLGLTHSTGDSSSIMEAVSNYHEVKTKLSQVDIDRYNKLKKGVRHISR